MVRSSCHWQKSIRFTFYSFWPTLRRLFVKSFFFYCFRSIQFIFSVLFFLLLLLFISEISKAYLVNRRMEERAKESAVGCWNIKLFFLRYRVENILIRSLTIFTFISCIYNWNKVCVYKLLIPFIKENT